MTNTVSPMPGSLPVVTDFSLSTFEGVVVSLIDLHRYVMANGQAVISRKIFIDCRVEGPCVMLAIGGVTFDGTDFGYTKGDIRNIVLFPASPDSVIGAIPVQDCVFKNCVFFGVGFTGPQSFTDQILALGDRP